MRSHAIRLGRWPLAIGLMIAFGCSTGTESESGSSGEADWDIGVSRSDDGGATWTAPAALNVNAGTDAGDDRQPQVTTDGQGTWVTVWQSNDSLGGTVGTDVDILLARSTDAGATWNAPTALNANAASDSESDWSAQMTTDGQGIWVAVWQSEETLGDTIGIDGDILMARSLDGGLTWTAPTALNTNAASDGGDDWSAQVTTDGQGTWVAVWDSNDSLGDTIGMDDDILMARSLDGGVTWTAPTALNTNATTDGEDDWSAQVTTDGQGTWTAVWTGSIGGDWDILAARSTDAGVTWTTPTALNTNAAGDTGHDYHPELSNDGQGTWVAVWYSLDSLGDTIGTDRDIMVARSLDDGATWSAPAPLGTNAATDGGDDWYPQLTTDGQGVWIAVWFSDDSLGDTIGTDEDILMARSTDGGVTWTSPTALNADATTDAENDWYPQLTTDGLGTWVSVWQYKDP